MTFVDTRHAKTPGYSTDIAKILAQGICPFCPDAFPGQWHTNPILKTVNSWSITRNMYSYPNSQEHFLIVGQRHIETLEDLQPEEFVNILLLAKWVTTELHIPGGLLALRFGNTRFSGATVRHLHAHLVVPAETNEQVSVVNFPVG